MGIDSIGLRSFIGFLALGCALPLAGCARGRAGEKTPPPAFERVDLERYAGLWHEVARLPFFFERNCVRATATYALRPDGKVSVVNACINRKGKRETAEGVARSANPPANSKLVVVFNNWFSRLFPGLTEGDYWILDLDPGYQTAIVGTPNYKYLWFLSRTPEVEETAFQEMALKARALGYDTAPLIRPPAGK